MKKLLTLTLLFMLAFPCAAMPASLSQNRFAEIVQTQIAYDTKITFGDTRYLCLENYPNITQKAIANFMKNPYKNMGQLFDCEDIAKAAQVRFVLTLCKLLPKLNSGIWWHGAPVGIVIYGNYRERHVINIIIYDGMAFMYDVGRKRILTPENIECSGFWIMQVAF